LDENTASSFLGISNCTGVEFKCWYGITPGVTTFDVSKMILEGLYEPNAMRVSEQYIEWTTQGTDGVSTQGTDGVLSGSIRADNTGVVTDVYIRIDTGTVDMVQIVEWIGEPDSVYIARAFSSEVRCAGSFVAYSNLGIELFLYPEHDMIGISPTQFVQSMIGISPTQFVQSIRLMQRENVGKWTDTWEIKWQGYTDYCALTASLP